MTRVDNDRSYGLCRSKNRQKFYGQGYPNYFKYKD